MRLDSDERDNWKIGRCPETIWDYQDDEEEIDIEDDEESILNS